MGYAINPNTIIFKLYILKIWSSYLPRLAHIDLNYIVISIVTKTKLSYPIAPICCIYAHAYINGKHFGGRGTC